MQKTPRLREVRRKQRSVLLGIIFALLIIGIGIMIWVLWQPWTRIHSVEIHGDGVFTSLSEVQTVVLEQVKGRAGIIPRDSAVFFSYSRIRTAIRSAFPAISEVSFSRDFSRTLTVNVKEYVPFGTWCGVSRDYASSCFLFDATGFIFSPTSEAPALVWFGPLRNDDEPLRNRIFTDGAISHVSTLLLRLTDAGIPVSHITFRSPDEVDFFIEGQGRLTYIVGDEATVGDSALFLLTGELKGVVFEYLDLRFGRKVYIKK